MRGKYAFTVSCLKEADDVWSLEFLSLGNSVPVNVIQHEELNQPLTDVPVVLRQEDPITYFRKLTQSVLTFLPGYHTRLLNQIRSRLARLETGEYLYAKVTYLNNGAEINSYNYEVELAKEIRQGDEIIEDKGVKVVIDPAATLFLMGSTVDWVESKFESGKTAHSLVKSYSFA